MALTASLCAKTTTAIVVVPYERSPFFSLTKGRQTDKFVSQCLTTCRTWWSCFPTLNSGGRLFITKKMIHLTTYTSFFESPHLVLISLNLYIFHNHIPANLPIGVAAHIHPCLVYQFPPPKISSKQLLQQVKLNIDFHWRLDMVSWRQALSETYSTQVFLATKAG